MLGPKDKKRAIHRLKIIRGQIDGLLKSVEKDTYCIEIIGQSFSIQESLKSLDAMILENHIQTCVKEDIGKKDKEKKVISELMKVYKLGRKDI